MSYLYRHVGLEAFDDSITIISVSSLKKQGDSLTASGSFLPITCLSCWPQVPKIDPRVEIDAGEPR